ncbi:MAG TPA: histone deacetylase [Spirochaetia bacterium]|nr:histone deacetylase [Spirochaetia bacterium]
MRKNTGLLFDDIFFDHLLSAYHVESPLRLEAVMNRIVSTGLKSKLKLIRPIDNREEIEQAILAVHSKIHLQSVVRWETKALPALRAVGAVLRGVDAVLKGEVENVFCAVRPPGHHAQNNGAHCDGRYQGEGFCFFNNVAIGARYAQHHYGVKRVLIVDWDYHHGNGIEWAFYNDPSVFYCSTHALFDYPTTGHPDKTGRGKGKGYNLNIPLPAYAGDSDIIGAFKDLLIPRLKAVGFVPDLVMVSAGFDSREKDLIGMFNITDKGFLELTKIVKGIAHTHCGGRLVSVLEGGYNPQGLSQAVAVHIRGLVNGNHVSRKLC